MTEKTKGSSKNGQKTAVEGELTPEMDVARHGDRSLGKQADRLAESRLPVGQRRSMAQRIGRVQGNRHLSRVLARLASYYQSLEATRQRDFAEHARSRQRGTTSPYSYFWNRVVSDVLG